MIQPRPRHRHTLQSCQTRLLLTSLFTKTPVKKELTQFYGSWTQNKHEKCQSYLKTSWDVAVIMLLDNTFCISVFGLKTRNHYSEWSQLALPSVATVQNGDGPITASSIIRPPWVSRNVDTNRSSQHQSYLMYDVMQRTTRRGWTSVLQLSSSHPNAWIVGVLQRTKPVSIFWRPSIISKFMNFHKISVFVWPVVGCVAARPVRTGPGAGGHQVLAKNWVWTRAPNFDMEWFWLKLNKLQAMILSGHLISSIPGSGFL